MVPILDYLLERQISPQWRGMLTALATEFEAQIGRDELRQLMHRVGCRFAAAHPLPACGSTAELAQTLNLYWQDMDWGYVELSDEAEYLRIVHYCAPLQAFGGAALTLDARVSRRRLSDVVERAGRAGSVGCANE